jgi:hypothetical protein
MKTLPSLPGDLRESVLWAVQDLIKAAQRIEELLCLTEEEEENDRS